MIQDWTNKVVAVTGAAQGIGSAIVRSFAGATVWALDIDEAAMNSLAEEPGVVPYRLDVSDEASVAVCIERIVQAHGRIDVLV
ncbi:MAG: SDR family NAD(P)-dependent oxidoreductase, partial [Chloroflexota bacterium]|nr:SDR family NAD(P)-dependent oxidoreductase [Chloroflexota bacterium]